MELKLQNFRFTNSLEHLRETFINSPIDNSNHTNNVDSKDLKLLKDLQKRFAEIEKSFKTFSASINVQNINKEIKDINDSVNNKIATSIRELTDVAENLSNF